MIGFSSLKNWLNLICTKLNLIRPLHIWSLNFTQKLNSSTTHIQAENMAKLVLFRHISRKYLEIPVQFFCLWTAKRAAKINEDDEMKKQDLQVLAKKNGRRVSSGLRKKATREEAGGPCRRWVGSVEGSFKRRSAGDWATHRRITAMTTTLRCRRGQAEDRHESMGVYLLYLFCFYHELARFWSSNFLCDFFRTFPSFHLNS